MKLINNEKTYTHQVTKSERLYTYLKDVLFISLRLTNELMKQGNLLINDQKIKKNLMLSIGDRITIHFLDETNNYELEDIPLQIVYETDDLLIINKQPNRIVHPTQHTLSHTYANGIAYYFHSKGLKRKIRFVNRLDMDTSGLLIVAKNPYAHQFIAKQFDEERITKKYLAIIDGKMNGTFGVIETEIENKPSKTLYRVIHAYDHYSLIECELKSGRTHQIRLHLATLGAYLLGDTYYHKASEYISRQALHAYELQFIEPRTFKVITLSCELPEDMKKLL